MTELSPGLGLPYLQPSRAQKHVPHNAALLRLDQLVQLRLSSLDASTTPVSPDPGEIHALGSSPTEAWAGRGNWPVGTAPPGSLLHHNRAGWPGI